MKRRYRYALNLLSIGFLLFALYLNFVRKESAEISAPSTIEKSGQQGDSHLDQASASLMNVRPSKSSLK